MLTWAWLAWLFADSLWLLGFRMIFPGGRPSWWRAIGGLLATAMPFLYAGSDATGLFFAVTIYASISTLTATVASVGRRQVVQNSGLTSELENKITEIQGHMSSGEELSKVITENSQLKEQVRNYENAISRSGDTQAEMERLAVRAELAVQALEVAERERTAAHEDSQRLRTTLSRFRRQQRVLSNAYQEKDEEHKQLQDQVKQKSNSQIHDSKDEIAQESQDGEALDALRVMTSTVDEQTRQLSEFSHQVHDKDNQIENLMNQLAATERDRDMANNKLASMEDLVNELNTCKAELSDMTDEVFELQTLLEAAKRQTLEAEHRPVPGGSLQSSGGNLSQKQREDMILARIRRSPAYGQ